MNTHDNIKLPPLPVWMSRYTVPADDFEGGDDRCLEGLMEEYAIDAIEPYAKRIAELEAALQSQDREDAGYESGRRCGLGFAHSAVSEILRKHYHGSGVEGLNKLIQQAADVIATEMDNPSTATTGIDHARRVDGIVPDGVTVEDFDEEVESNDCDYCSGTGEGMYDGQSCAVCRGKGFL